MDRKDNHDRWLHLINTAERIFEIGRQGGYDNDLKEIAVNVQGVLEVFSREIDPLTDLEGYAVRHFVRAILPALELQSQE